MKVSENNMYVTFKLDDENCGFLIDNVTSIERVLDITRLPNGPDHVEGVINLRGEVIALINLRKLLALKERPMDNKTRIIIVSFRDMLAGIIVDSSSEVKEINSKNIDIPPLAEDANNYRYIQGIGKTEDGIITILNIEEIFKR